MALEEHEDSVDDDDEPPPAPRLEDEPEPPTRPQYPGPGVWAKPAAASGIDVGFVPIRTYAQKRHTESVRHLPRSAAYEDAHTAEEVAAAPRLRQVLSSKKVQEVYSEEGYGDSAYNHGDYGRNAQQEEDYENRERNKKPTRSRGRHYRHQRHRDDDDDDDAYAAGSSNRESAVATPDSQRGIPIGEGRMKHKISHRQEITYAVTEVRDVDTPGGMPYEFAQASELKPARIAVPAAFASQRVVPKIQRRSDDVEEEVGEEEEDNSKSEAVEEKEDNDAGTVTPEEFESRRKDAPPPTTPAPTPSPAPAPTVAEPTAEASHAGASPGGPPVWSEEFLKSLPLQLPGVAGDDGASASQTEEVGFLPVRAMAKPAMAATGPTEQELLWRRIQATYSIPMIDGRPVQPARPSKSSGRSVGLGALPPQLAQPTPAPSQPRGAVAYRDQAEDLEDDAPSSEVRHQPPQFDPRVTSPIHPPGGQKIKTYSAEQQKLPPSLLKPKEAQQWDASYAEPEATASTRYDDGARDDPRQQKFKAYSPVQQEISRGNKDNIGTYQKPDGKHTYTRRPYFDSRTGALHTDRSVPEDKESNIEQRTEYSDRRKELSPPASQLTATVNFERSPEQLKERKASGILPYFDSKLTSSSNADESRTENQSGNQPQTAEHDESWIPSETPTREDYAIKNRPSNEEPEEDENEKVETDESAPEEQDVNDQDEEQQGKQEDNSQRTEDDEEREPWGFVPYFESKVTFPVLREQLKENKNDEEVGTREYPNTKPTENIKYQAWNRVPSYSGPEIYIPKIDKPVESEKIFIPPKENIRDIPPEVPISSPKIRQPEPTTYEAPPPQQPVHRDMTTYVPIKVISSTGFIETMMVPKEEVEEEEPEEKANISSDDQPVDVLPYFDSNFTSVTANQQSDQNYNETLRQLMKLPPPLKEVETVFQTPTPLVFGILPKTKLPISQQKIGPLHFGIYPKSTPAPIAFESTRVSPNRILAMSSRKVNKTANATSEVSAETTLKVAVTPLPLNKYPGEIFRSSPRVQPTVQPSASETVTKAVTSPLMEAADVIEEVDILPPPPPRKDGWAASYQVMSPPVEAADVVEDVDIPPPQRDGWTPLKAEVMIEDVNIPPPPPPRKDGWAPAYPVLASVPSEYMAQYLPLVASGAASMASLLNVLQSQASHDINRRTDSEETDFTSPDYGASNDTVPMVIWVPLNTTLGSSLLKLQGLPAKPTLASQKPASVPPEPYFVPSPSPSHAVLSPPSTSSPSTPPTEALQGAASADAIRSRWSGPNIWAEPPQLTAEGTEAMEKLNAGYKGIIYDKSNANDTSVSATNSTFEKSAESNSTTSGVDLPKSLPETSTASATTTPYSATHIASAATTTPAVTASGKTTDATTTQVASTASPVTSTGGKRYDLELSRVNRPQQEQQAEETQTTEELSGDAHQLNEVDDGIRVHEIFKTKQGLPFSQWFAKLRKLFF